MKEHMEFIRLWYVDEEYLNSLYNQISENVTSLKVSEDRVSDKDGGVGIDIGNLVSKIGFPIGLSLKTRYNVRKSVFEEKTITPSIESKIKEVVNHLEPKRTLSSIIMQHYETGGIML